MLRRLLACLALLTGLAAAGVPAQAEVAVAIASRIEASAAGDSCAAGQMAVRPVEQGAAETLARARLDNAEESVCLVFSAVYLRIDRARE